MFIFSNRSICITGNFCSVLKVIMLLPSINSSEGFTFSFKWYLNASYARSARKEPRRVSASVYFSLLLRTCEEAVKASSENKNVERSFFIPDD